MSYNIDSVEYISGELHIDRDVRAALAEQYDGDCAESNFLADDCYVIEDGDTLRIEYPAWCGEWSGNSEPVLREALSKTTGCADLLLTWEGGDSHSGLRVVNGKVTRHDVLFALGKECE